METLAWVEAGPGAPRGSSRKTDPNERHKGISLLVLERGMDGLVYGRNLPKIGLNAQDTAEWHLTDVHVPVASLLGEEGKGGGYGYLLEYPVARAWADARISRIYGGTTEIIKEVVGRELGL